MRLEVTLCQTCLQGPCSMLHCPKNETANGQIIFFFIRYYGWSYYGWKHYRTFLKHDECFH